MFVETRVLGKRSRPLDDWSIPLPPPAGDDSGESLTLRELIARVVRHEVREFTARDKARRLLRVLSSSEIDEQGRLGRVVSGGRPASPAVDEEQAVAVALQGFVDGLYLVVLDGVEQRDLDAQVFVNDQSRMVFLRLTFLAGA